MFSDTDLSNGFVPGTEGSTTNKLKPHVSIKNLENPDGKIGFSDKGNDLLRDSEVGFDGFRSKSYSRIGNLGSQELTLSYLCDNPKMSFQEKEISGKNLFSVLEKDRYKGKEVISENPEERLVERDFLQLNGVRAAGTKRELDQEIEREMREKKAKLETLNLSLALPDVSLSLTSSPNADHFAHPKPTRSTQSLAPSNNNTRTASSDDFTAASLSYSYSVPFSHNPSCSLFTRNSTENYEYSESHQKDTDHIWYCGEGTNGSVHSRFRPVGDGSVVLANHGGGGGFGHQLMQSNRQINKDSSNSLYRTTSSDNQSFLPSELPARPKKEDTASMDSRGRASRKNSDGSRARKLTRPERILLEIVSDSIPVMAQILQELPDETIESAKEHMSNLIGSPEKREELTNLQNRLERRSDLTFETLSKSHRDQLEILVAIKTGLVNYISGKNRLPMTELVEIFLLMRCRNVNCSYKGLLPVDDCDCKICSTKKGFCSACMCPVCLNFDCASNTCSWVGCDACSHWCHASCGIQRNLIRPGPNLKGSAGTTEMQFYCLGCDHASEMFGFVKDVFLCCAKDWGLETLKKELDCVRKIFRGSENFKEKELQSKAEETLLKLENKIISPSEACDSILQFFKYGASAIPGSGASSKDLTLAQICQQADVVSLSTTSPPSKSTTYNMSSSSGRPNLLPNDVNQNILTGALTRERRVEDELESTLKKDGFDSLESIVRIKEAEARMFQSHADEARREAEGYRRMVRIKSEKLEEEYAGKLAKLCLQETEERRRKKLEELKNLENSHCDYYKMKLRMQDQIAGLLERMEATKKQWV
ncbi:protein OBERON 3-like [Telopea speciosissima]|uniref:protein OBERON 3-like n=1 Tax=Telopea speciosissima TaxID=54955 RepID=UPI001CC3BAD0|nr:protein OBERON 3-like [Telopea speciosissima]